MNKLETDISLDDASYKSCEMQNRELTIFLNSWDEKTIKLVFSNTVQFQFKEGSFLSGIYVTAGKNPFLEDALSSYYEKIPANNPFKLYLVRDIEDASIFQVVAENIQITKIT